MERMEEYPMIQYESIKLEFGIGAIRADKWRE
jgi:hypothetical protein